MSCWIFVYIEKHGIFGVNKLSWGWGDNESVGERGRGDRKSGSYNVTNSI